MPQGFEAYDAAGVLIVRVTDRLPRVVYRATITGSGSYTDAAFGTGSLFSQAMCLTTSGSLVSFYRVLFTLSGTTVSWAFPPGMSGSCIIVLGVY